MSGPALYGCVYCFGPATALSLSLSLFSPLVYTQLAQAAQQCCCCWSCHDDSLVCNICWGAWSCVSYSYVACYWSSCPVQRERVIRRQGYLLPVCAWGANAPMSAQSPFLPAACSIRSYNPRPGVPSQGVKHPLRALFVFCATPPRASLICTRAPRPIPPLFCERRFPRRTRPRARFSRSPSLPRRAACRTRISSAWSRRRKTSQSKTAKIGEQRV